MTALKRCSIIVLMFLSLALAAPPFAAAQDNLGFCLQGCRDQYRTEAIICARNQSNSPAMYKSCMAAAVKEQSECTHGPHGCRSRRFGY